MSPLSFFHATDRVIALLLLLLIATIGCTPGSAASPVLAALPGQSDEAGSSDSVDAEDAAEEAVDEMRTLPVAADADHPFPNRGPAPDFPKGLTWLNTAKPIHVNDLKGKFVLLDFWTYCCINCIHILPELKKLEHAYPNNLVVIGVHSAKFETEKGSDNIASAILRYEIEHPVVNDKDHRIWNLYGVNSWPSIVLIDPEGNFVGRASGEFKFETIDRLLKQVVPYYRKKKTLDETPVRFERLAYDAKETPLQFPGKVLADEASNRLFIADSNHNRIVVTDLAGKLINTIGSGEIGENDGSFAEATFDHPQGMALRGNLLYVADTENHRLRKIDLENGTVATIAGTGEQGGLPFPGAEEMRAGGAAPKRFVGLPRRTALNSPWALHIHGEDLYIAMAGPHQIWKMPLDESEIGPYAGNGREDIVDGALLPDEPYQAEGLRGGGLVTFSAFAQPSGLASDGEWLYVADSEGSSIRAVPFDMNKPVQTLVGTSNLVAGRLFEFGLVDGARDKAKLQHPLGVAWHDGKVYVADTYNNAIRVVDCRTGAVQTVAGVRAPDPDSGILTGQPGDSDEDGSFDEPAGLSYAGGKLYVADTNNHAIRVIDLATKKTSTLQIAGLAAPGPAESVKKKPDFTKARKHLLPTTKVRPVDGKVVLKVKFQLPAGWKINELAPMQYYPDSPEATGPIDREALGDFVEVEKPTSEFTVALPVAADGVDTVTIGMNYYYCQKDGGLCKIGSVIWTAPLEISSTAADTEVELEHKIITFP
ncbi:thioredoxin-like domain-containing protein [Lignipirellula cremea]|uniref:Thiol-disulfide oxidoreductase ResA n=1 Tax=Lignipirellula cremea TaxID=2528010 RepID=A0A518E1S9_9BACT|nr:thioredoxin-like domain-containing protein [Lignipirellula cremea]QDU98049.1 Thiol-disulfide oxidoreductase ResA [Lignipirellula cremea]